MKIQFTITATSSEATPGLCAHPTYSGWCRHLSFPAFFTVFMAFSRRPWCFYLSITGALTALPLRTSSCHGAHTALTVCCVTLPITDASISTTITSSTSRLVTSGTGFSGEHTIKHFSTQPNTGTKESKDCFRSHCGVSRRHGVMAVEFLYNQMNVHNDVYVHISFPLHYFVWLVYCHASADWRKKRIGNAMIAVKTTTIVVGAQ